MRQTERKRNAGPVADTAAMVPLLDTLSTQTRELAAALQAERNTETPAAQAPQAPRQVDISTSPAPDRYDALRRATLCPLCNRRKALALLACWDCYRAHDMRNGLQPATRHIIEHAADAANAAELVHNARNR